ncbi:transporter substrate-binding domain-containing protein [Furfurilactobacillus siliginis]
MMNKKFVYALIAVATAGLVTFGLGSHQTASAKSASYQDELVKKGTLTVGLEGVFPPYSYRKDGKLTGFEVDLARKLGKEMNVKVNIVPTKWDGLIAGVGSKRFDVVINNVTPTPERRKAYAFTTPYIYSHYVLVTQKKDTKIKSVKDIKGKKFVEGTGTDNQQVAKKFDATVIPNSNFDTTLDMIKDGRADGTVNSESAWRDYKKTNSAAGLKAQKIANKDVEPAEVAALLSKQSPALRKQMNKALSKMRADGSLKQLSVKYFGTDVTKK